MAGEKVVKINLRNRLNKVPRWRRRNDLVRLLKRKLKNDKIAIDKRLNENIWSGNSPKVRLKIVKDGKTVKAEIVE